MRWGWMWIVVLAGCYHATPGQDAPCPDHVCPIGQTCDPVDLVCVAQLRDAAMIGSDAVLAGDTLPVDAPVADDGPAPFAVAHLSAADAASLQGAGDLAIPLGTSATIDTSALTVTGATNPGRLVTMTQVGGGEVAVLDLHDLFASGTLHVVGTRPLIVVAAHDIGIGGMLDASADAQTPGAGGFGPAAGPGSGASGTTTAMYQYEDTGGGGGAFGQAGASGGKTADLAASPGGAPYGDVVLAVLRGGSGGGNAAACQQGGAGGGAIQLTAEHQVTVPGTIDAGGGGGQGGIKCPAADYASGGGGGAGGAIYIQAAHWNGTGGVLAANGGGGGGGADFPDGAPGMDGANGTTSTAPAAGGTSGAMGSIGGDGGVGGTAPTAGADAAGNNNNGAGGGGGAGRIYLDIAPGDAVAATCSPACARS